MNVTITDRTARPTKRRRRHSAAKRRFRQLLRGVDEFGGCLGMSLGPCFYEISFVHEDRKVKAMASFEPSGVCLFAQIAHTEFPADGIRAMLDEFQATWRYCRARESDGNITLRIASPYRLKAPDAAAVFRRLVRDFVSALWNERFHAALERHGATLCAQRHEAWGLDEPRALRERYKRPAR